MRYPITEKDERQYLERILSEVFAPGGLVSQPIMEKAMIEGFETDEGLVAYVPLRTDFSHHAGITSISPPIAQMRRVVDPSVPFAYFVEADREEQERAANSPLNDRDPEAYMTGLDTLGTFSVPSYQDHRHADLPEFVRASDAERAAHDVSPNAEFVYVQDLGDYLRTARSTFSKSRGTAKALRATSWRTDLIRKTS